jgi:ankyrin repeat protein
MRVALIALILTIGSQAGAECGNLCDWDWRQTATAADVQSEIDAGADVNARTEYTGLTPLHLFLPNVAPEIIQTLLAAGADVTARDKGGSTPLHASVSSGGLISSHLYNGNPKNIVALLRAGADVMARTDYGRTPLHYAASNFSAANFRVLWGAGASIFAQDLYGNTPLHLAASKSETGFTIQALLTAGADAKAKNKKGETPWDLAQENEKLKGTKGYWALNDAQYN